MTFFNILSEHENLEVELVIYNILKKKSRVIKIIPNRNWPNAESLLGIMVRFEEYENCLERTFKLLKVFVNSPAEKVGIVANDDYIIGLTHYKIKDLHNLHEIIMQNKDG